MKEPWHTRQGEKKTHTRKWNWGDFTIFFKKTLPRRVSAEHLAGFHERDHTGSIFTLFTLFFNKKKKGKSFFGWGRGGRGLPRPAPPFFRCSQKKSEKSENAWCRGCCHERRSARQFNDTRRRFGSKKG
jgi:hypothetical protein